MIYYDPFALTVGLLLISDGSNQLAASESRESMVFPETRITSSRSTNLEAFQLHRRQPDTRIVIIELE